MAGGSGAVARQRPTAPGPLSDERARRAAAGVDL